MTIPQAAIDAASISLGGPKYAFQAREDAKRALEAAMPHIREQIAQEIEAKIPEPSDRPVTDQHKALNAAISVAIQQGMKLASRIVRGDT